MHIDTYPSKIYAIKLTGVCEDDRSSRHIQPKSKRLSCKESLEKEKVNKLKRFTHSVSLDANTPSNPFSVNFVSVLLTADKPRYVSSEGYIFRIQRSHFIEHSGCEFDWKILPKSESFHKTV